MTRAHIILRPHVVLRAHVVLRTHVILRTGLEISAVVRRVLSQVTVRTEVAATAHPAALVLTRAEITTETLAVPELRAKLLVLRLLPLLRPKTPGRRHALRRHHARPEALPLTATVRLEIGQRHLRSGSHAGAAVELVRPLRPWLPRTETRPHAATGHAAPGRSHLRLTAEPAKVLPHRRTHAGSHWLAAKEPLPHVLPHHFPAVKTLLVAALRQALGQIGSLPTPRRAGAGRGERNAAARAELGLRLGRALLRLTFARTLAVLQAILTGTVEAVRAAAFAGKFAADFRAGRLRRVAGVGTSALPAFRAGARIGFFIGGVRFHRSQGGGTAQGEGCD